MHSQQLPAGYCCNRNEDLHWFLVSKSYTLPVGKQPKSRTSSPTLLLPLDLSPLVGSPSTCIDTDLWPVPNCLQMKTPSAFLLGDHCPSTVRKRFCSERVWKMMTVEKAAQANKVNAAPSLDTTSLSLVVQGEDAPNRHKHKSWAEPETWL